MTQQSIPPPPPVGTIRLAEQRILEVRPPGCDRHPSAAALVTIVIWTSFIVIARSTTTPKPNELAEGISTALITTLVGLVLNEF